MFNAASAYQRRRRSHGYRDVMPVTLPRRVTLSLSSGIMPAMKARSTVAGAVGSVAAAAALALAVAAPAQADIDTNFANELHTFGIYGQKDYNAWIGKIVCKRLNTGLDADSVEAHRFIAMNMEKDTSAEQSWQFLGSAMKYYCPDKLSVLLPAEVPA
jgi:hypothetical protein